MVLVANIFSGTLLVAHNVYVYETFGILKHFTFKLQVLLIRAETFNNLQTAKCFIYDVVSCHYFIFNSFKTKSNALCEFILIFGVTPTPSSVFPSLAK